MIPNLSAVPVLLTYYSISAFLPVLFYILLSDDNKILPVYFYVLITPAFKLSDGKQWQLQSAIRSLSRQNKPPKPHAAHAAIGDTDTIPTSEAIVVNVR